MGSVERRRVGVHREGVEFGDGRVVESDRAGGEVGFKVVEVRGSGDQKQVGGVMQQPGAFGTTLGG